MATPGDLLEPPPLLTRAQQSEYLRLLARGASPVAACQQLGVPLFAGLETAASDELFRARIAGIQILLSQNVAAALYRAAMEGQVSAQTSWLRFLPPPGWNPSAQSPGVATPGTDLLEQLPEDDLKYFAGVVGLPPPPEPAIDPDLARSPTIPFHFPQAPPPHPA